MQDPIVISFYTYKTFYEKEAARLLSSCDRVGLEHQIVGIDPFGKWHEHVCYKPFFIYKKLLELKRPLLWLDADAEIVRKPPFQFEQPIGIRCFDCYPPEHPNYLFASTIYVDYQPQIVELMKAWGEECQKALEKHPGLEVSDQPILQSLLSKMKIPFDPLPVGYAAIFENEQDLPPDQLYIVQYQASRLYRKFINGEVVPFGAFEHLSVDELRKLRPRVYRS